MKNPAPHLRRSLFTLLDGAVSYESKPVKVYEGEGQGEGRQIIIGEYSDSDRSNSHMYGANASQVIEIVATQRTAAKKHVDAIGDLVMNLVQPTIQSHTLDNDDFFVIIGRPSINHIVENSGTGDKIVRLILRYNLNINHN